MSRSEQATTPAPAAASRPGLTGKLLAAVRPEFRVEIFTVDPRDPIFGGPPCRVAGCDRTTRIRGICLGHYHRWKQLGCPDIDEFVATTTAAMRGHRPVESCA